VAQLGKPLIAELLEVLGEEAFVKLCQAFGGTRLYVPREVQKGHEICEAIGKIAAQKLVQRFSPGAVRVPLAKRERVLFYRRLGFSHAEIARLVGMGETSVERISQQARAEAEMSLVGRQEPSQKL
jgi:hypothetical protein